ncbi:hypothetical protein KM043_015844 [Ampulex compressa]|nr:hypothetical protein KM043_015844 [Ampulex compressa]
MDLYHLSMVQHPGSVFGGPPTRRQVYTTWPLCEIAEGLFKELRENDFARVLEDKQMKDYAKDGGRRVRLRFWADKQREITDEFVLQDARKDKGELFGIGIRFENGFTVLQ